MEESILIKPINAEALLVLSQKCGMEQISCWNIIKTFLDERNLLISHFDEWVVRDTAELLNRLGLKRNSINVRLISNL